MTGEYSFDDPTACYVRSGPGRKVIMHYRQQSLLGIVFMAGLIWTHAEAGGVDIDVPQLVALTTQSQSFENVEYTALHSSTFIVVTAEPDNGESLVRTFDPYTLEEQSRSRIQTPDIWYAESSESLLVINHRVDECLIRNSVYDTKGELHFQLDVSGCWLNPSPGGTYLHSRNVMDCGSNPRLVDRSGNSISTSLPSPCEYLMYPVNDTMVMIICEDKGIGYVWDVFKDHEILSFAASNPKVKWYQGPRVAISRSGNGFAVGWHEWVVLVTLENKEVHTIEIDELILNVGISDDLGVIAVLHYANGKNTLSVYDVQGLASPWRAPVSKSLMRAEPPATELTVMGEYVVLTYYNEDGVNIGRKSDEFTPTTLVAQLDIDRAYIGIIGFSESFGRILPLACQDGTLYSLSLNLEKHGCLVTESTSYEQSK